MLNWLKSHKVIAIGGGIFLVVLAFLIIKRRTNVTSTSSTTGGSAGVPGVPAAVGRGIDGN